DLSNIRRDVLDLHVLESQRLRAVVLDHDQYRENAILVRVELSEWSFGEVAVVEWDCGDRDLVGRLLGWITGRSAGNESGLLVGRDRQGGHAGEKGYTRYCQPIAHHRHLSPVSPLSSPGDAVPSSLLADPVDPSA